MSGFTAVNFIDLVSVSYADGTSWACFKWKDLSRFSRFIRLVNACPTRAFRGQEGFERIDFKICQ
jgi:hypothetical protein